MRLSFILRSRLNVLIWLHEKKIRMTTKRKKENTGQLLQLKHLYKKLEETEQETMLNFRTARATSTDVKQDWKCAHPFVSLYQCYLTICSETLSFFHIEWCVKTEQIEIWRKKDLENHKKSKKENKKTHEIGDRQSEDVTAITSKPNEDTLSFSAFQYEHTLWILLSTPINQSINQNWRTLQNI